MSAAPKEFVSPHSPGEAVPSPLRPVRRAAAYDIAAALQVTDQALDSGRARVGPIRKAEAPQ